MGEHGVSLLFRSAGLGLLTVLLSAVTMAASAAPVHADPSLSDIRATVAGQAPGLLLPVLVAWPTSLITIRPRAGSTKAGEASPASASIRRAGQDPSWSATKMPSTVPAAGAMTYLPQASAPTGPVSTGLWLAMLAVFLGLAGLVATLAMPVHVSRRQRTVQSIQGYDPGAGSSQADQRSAVLAISTSLIHLGDKVMDSRESTPRTQRLLERADLPVRPGEWAVLRGVAIVVGVAGGLVLMHGGSISTFIGACLGAGVGVIGPAFFLKFAASRRAKKFEAQLPDVLTLVASSLSTGFSLLQALDAVARDATEPSAKEFARALAETRIGTDLNDALEHLADRMDSSNLRWTGMAISIQRQVGGNLAETLRSTAATLRDRQSLIRHVNALSAEGKLSAYILIALPIGVFVYMLGVNKAYVELLWTTLIGIGMLSAGLISLGIGVFWMRKVVKVEV
jgi:tight adherence protein B